MVWEVYMVVILDKDLRLEIEKELREERIRDEANDYDEERRDQSEERGW